MRIAFDPTPQHSTHSFLEFPRVTADLGYEWIHETWDEVSRFQLQAIKDGVSAARASLA